MFLFYVCQCLFHLTNSSTMYSYGDALWFFIHDPLACLLDHRSAATDRNPPVAARVAWISTATAAAVVVAVLMTVVQHGAQFTVDERVHADVAEHVAVPQLLDGKCASVSIVLLEAGRGGEVVAGVPLRQAQCRHDGVQAQHQTHPRARPP